METLEWPKLVEEHVVLEWPGVVPEFTDSRSCFVEFPSRETAQEAVELLAQEEGLVEHKLISVWLMDDGKYDVYFVLNAPTREQEDAFIEAAVVLGGTYTGS